MSGKKPDMSQAALQKKAMGYLPKGSEIAGVTVDAPKGRGKHATLVVVYNYQGKLCRARISMGARL